MSIGILTDSTCDLPRSIIDKYEIEIVPLSVHFGNKTFTDGIDITPELFFRKLDETDKFPRTSRPSITAFINKYKQMSKKYDHILSIHVSENLSGTMESARLASRQLNDIKIHHIDSASISLGLGFLVLLAARLNEKNIDPHEIIETIKKARNNMLLYFTVDEFKYMKQGGRIGKARAFLGSILNIKPIISISTETGKVLPLEKLRGSFRAMKKMVDIAGEKINQNKYAWIGLAHGNREQDAEKFKSLLVNKIKEFNNLNYNIFTSRISPTLGCHVGPTVYAAVILTGDYLNI